MELQIESLVRTDEKRTAQWSEFKTWLDAHGPFDVVIDAANVGYFNQNYAGYASEAQRVLVALDNRTV